MQPATYRADRDLEQTGDGRVVEILDLAQDQDLAELRAELPECETYLVGSLESLQPRPGGLARIDRFAAGDLLGPIGGLFRFASTVPIRRDIERDAVNPSVEVAIAPKCPQFHICLNHRVLDDVFGFIRLPDQVEYAGEEPILTAAHQLTERIAVALLGLSDQNLLGFHIGYRGLGFERQLCHDVRCTINYGCGAVDNTALPSL